MGLLSFFTKSAAPEPMDVSEALKVVREVYAPETKLSAAERKAEVKRHGKNKDHQHFAVHFGTALDSKGKLLKGPVLELKRGADSTFIKGSVRDIAKAVAKNRASISKSPVTGSASQDEILKLERALRLVQQLSPKDGVFQVNLTTASDATCSLSFKRHNGVREENVALRQDKKI